MRRELTLLDRTHSRASPQLGGGITETDTDTSSPSPLFTGLPTLIFSPVVLVPSEGAGSKNIATGVSSEGSVEEPGLEREMTSFKKATDGVVGGKKMMTSLPFRATTPTGVKKQAAVRPADRGTTFHGASTSPLPETTTTNTPVNVTNSTTTTSLTSSMTPPPSLTTDPEVLSNSRPPLPTRHHTGDDTPAYPTKGKLIPRPRGGMPKQDGETAGMVQGDSEEEGGDHNDRKLTTLLKLNTPNVAVRGGEAEGAGGIDGEQRVSPVLTRKGQHRTPQSLTGKTDGALRQKGKKLSPDEHGAGVGDIAPLSPTAVEDKPKPPKPRPSALIFSHTGSENSPLDTYDYTSPVSPKPAYTPYNEDRPLPTSLRKDPGASNPFADPNNEFPTATDGWSEGTQAQARTRPAKKNKEPTYPGLGQPTPSPTVMSPTPKKNPVPRKVNTNSHPSNGPPTPMRDKRTAVNPGEAYLTSVEDLPLYTHPESALAMATEAIKKGETQETWFEAVDGLVIIRQMIVHHAEVGTCDVIVAGLVTA